MGQFYKASGRVNPIYILFFLLGAVAVAILSVVYSLTMRFIPLIYLNILITFGFGFLAGIIISFAIKMGKMRNNIVWMFTVICYFAIFIVFHFAAFVTLYLFGVDFSWFVSLLLSPASVLNYLVHDIVPHGVWSFRDNSSNASGLPLVGIWVIEHIIVFAVIYAVSICKTPFFEDSDCWGAEKRIDVKFRIQPYETHDEIINAIEIKNADYFLKSDDDVNFS
ncbi:MAG: hypothetical protein LBI27_00135, partial [Clostridiales bacterium]|nr:hypothetical protein [Clostridiales bacterium]